MSTTTQPRTPTTFPPAPLPSSTPSNTTKPAKRSPRSKPILTWLQRKLASAGRRASVSAGSSSRPQTSAPNTTVGTGNGRSKYSQLNGTSNSNGDSSYHGTYNTNGTPLHPIRTTPSSHSTSSRGAQASPTPTSDWTPTEPPTADDDASTRPLPPTSPPSPAPSRQTYANSLSSSSAYGHQQSINNPSISTKPTTLLSIDAAPPAQQQQQQQQHFNHNPPPSIHFSHLPPASPVPTTASPTPTTPHPSNSNSSSSTYHNPFPNTTPRAPPHSLPNPARNPPPLSAPADNASILTLASSTNAGRTGSERFNPYYDASEEGGYSYSYGDGYGYGGNASVRALKPRSRRGSWGTGGTGLGSLQTREGEDPEGERVGSDAEDEQEESPRHGSGPPTPTPGTPVLELEFEPALEHVDTTGTETATETSEESK